MNNNCLKLKIEIENLPHKVIRKVLVPENLNMHQLHLVIQESVGWFNAHLFEFSDAKGRSKIRVGIPDEFDEEFEGFGSAPKQNVFDVLLKNSFLHENGAKAFWYWYDFGDDWWHRISFLKTTQKDLKQYAGIPICVSAEGKCPPEDVGGQWGYAEFLKAINDKTHPEFKEYREWCGMGSRVKYDEMEIDLDDINVMLSEIYESEEWNATEVDDLF